MTLATLGVIAGIILAGIFLIPLVFRFIHAARLREMYTAITLLIVVGIGYLMTIVGLSPALGTFLAGGVLANSEFRHELESDVEPFEGLLLGLFFMTVGAGIGRFGQIVNRMVRHSGYETVVLDNDLRMIQLMRKFGFKGFFGDPTRPEILHAPGLHEASVLVVAIDDKEAVERLIHYARSERPDLHIVARAHDRVHVYRLFRAGANDIVREMFDSSLRAGRYVLEDIGLSEYEAHEA